jgi:hypothetical protein
MYVAQASLFSPGGDTFPNTFVRGRSRLAADQDGPSLPTVELVPPSPVGGGRRPPELVDRRCRLNGDDSTVIRSVTGSAPFLVLHPARATSPRPGVAL